MWTHWMRTGPSSPLLLRQLPSRWPIPVILPRASPVKRTLQGLLATLLMSTHLRSLMDSALKYELRMALGTEQLLYSSVDIGGLNQRYQVRIQCPGVPGDQTNNPSGQSRLDDSTQQKSLVIGNDEVAVWTYANLSANTQERIKRFERETKAMLQRDLSRQRRDMEKHEADKKRIEQELQQAKKDLESEDLLDAIADNPSDITKNIPDTISHTGVSSRKPPTRDIKYNLSTIGRRLSSSSLPSTSSNTSFSANASYVFMRSTPLQDSSSHIAMEQMDLSTKGSPLLGFTQTKKLGTTHFFPEAPRGPNNVTLSPRNSLPSSGYSSSTLVGTRNVEQTPNRSSTRSRSSVSTVRVSLPGPEQQSLQRSGSVENLQAQQNKLTHNGTLKRLKTGNEQVINIKYSIPMTYLVLTDNSQLTADGFEKLPDQIMYLYAKPYDLQKHVFSICHF
ncbi:unnamed protein product [Timema podura]|uniref:Uncharacterized protein n=1 Tax=Timema podura TaxID=61482 RepID=A0ABN7NHK5_TIMPD|nr:unnamed protein product [Timema podura]